MTKLNTLSPEQIAKLSAYRDRFLAVGLSTAPADFDAAETAMRDAYKAAGLDPPRCMIRLRSPREGARAAAMLSGSNLAPNIRDQVRAQVWAQVGDQVGHQIRDQVRAQVRDQVRAQVWARVWDQVWDQVRAQVGRALYGQHDASWLAFYAFFARECGIADAARLEPLTRLAEACGWCWTFKGSAILTDRPERIRRDNAFRLHADDGPALLYRDGFAIYAWHGQRLPASHQWIITDKARITAKAVMAEPNAELRRIMLEVSGFAPIMDRAKVLAEDVDGNGHTRRLLSARVGGDEIRIVDVLNGSLEPDGSRRRFVLGAMPGATPHECIAASYGIAPKHYREAVRT